MRNILLLLVFCVACSTSKDPGQKPVEYVALNRLAGNWFEVGRYETPMQSECGSAKLTLKVQGEKIDMLHACHDKNSKKTIHTHGTAEVVDTKSNAKWKASYMPVFQNWGMFGGSIWIVGIDSDYQYALLGHPTHKHFWILSRTAEITPEKYQELVELAKAKGYKPKLIQRVPTWK